jgi:NAD(P)-dependent dehydrogenase (short-subunit alcohol dehydrogenase family)
MSGRACREPDPRHDEGTRPDAGASDQRRALAAQPTKKFVTVDQVAAFALFLCRDEASAITGANLSMDGGWTAQ